MAKFENLVGRKFNSLVVVGRAPSQGAHAMWLCRCECGRQSVVETNNLRTGKQGSCGNQTAHPKNDIAGMKFNMLTALYAVEDKRHGQYWMCHCDCGNKKVVNGGALRHGRVMSCGCYGPTAAKDLAGRRFGMLTAIKRTPAMRGRQTKWACVCDCGNVTDVALPKLMSGHTKSCGCFKFVACKERRGSKNPNWNPNKSAGDRQRQRREEGDIAWRKMVFKRDCYRCHICNKNGNVQAHHLDGYHWAKENRRDPNNGVTLCVGHHNDFHDKYGRGHNTRQQYEEFFETFVMRATA